MIKRVRLANTLSRITNTLRYPQDSSARSRTSIGAEGIEWSCMGVPPRPWPAPRACLGWPSNLCGCFIYIFCIRLTCCDTRNVFTKRFRFLPPVRQDLPGRLPMCWFGRVPLRVGYCDFVCFRDLRKLFVLFWWRVIKLCCCVVEYLLWCCTWDTFGNFNLFIVCMSVHASAAVLAQAKGFYLGKSPSCKTRYAKSHILFCCDLQSSFGVDGCA